MIDYLYALSDEARKELIALTLLGLDDFDDSYQRVLDRYWSIDDQVLYLMGKTSRIAENVRIAMTRLAPHAGSEER